MVRMITTHTDEIDDVEQAVAEILAQIEAAGGLDAHSVGILSCYAEFIDSGVVAALCEALPFDTVGATTLASAVGGAAGLMQLSLAVLTSDEATFSTAYTAPLSEQAGKAPIAAAYRAAAAGHAQPPALVLMYMPLLPDVAGELLWQWLAEEAGPAPVFGTLSCDHTVEFTETYTIYNGQTSREAMALLMIHGDIHPRFFVTAIAEEKIQKERALITASDGYLLREVNDMPVLAYMQTLGLVRDDGLEGMRALPFVIDYGDGGQPVARAILRITEEGHAVCCGFMPEGARLGIGSIDHAEILTSAEDVVCKALAEPDAHVMLAFTCLVRNYTLGGDTMAELDRVQACAQGRGVSFLASYSGGEACPVKTAEGKLVNRFHNFTFTACVF